MYKVLIVEPQEFSLAALLNLPVWEKETEGHEGFECVDTAANGQDALELVRDHHYDLILTEINLTLCDGLQLLKQIHVNNQPPLVVFISDIVTFSYAREGFIYGAFDYLPKPVSQQDMENLFSRATNELERIKKQQLSIMSLANVHFNPEQINRLLDSFDRRNQKVLSNIQLMIRSLYNSPNKKDKHPDLLANKLYLSLVEGIYARHEWIQLYIPRSFYEQIDYLELANPDDFAEFYVRKFTYLFEKYCVLNPKFEDKTLVKIHTYLLEHPEENLKLTAIADLFYLNHTYLSNLFSKKSPLRYSQLVSLVKMHRAEYLINYTDLSFEDIASQLRYKDFHYFLKLFKEIMGKSVNEYIRNDDSFDNYTI